MDLCQQSIGNHIKVAFQGVTPLLNIDSISNADVIIGSPILGPLK